MSHRKSVSHGLTNIIKKKQLQKYKLKKEKHGFTERTSVVFIRQLELFSVYLKTIFIKRILPIFHWMKDFETLKIMPKATTKPLNTVSTKQPTDYYIYIYAAGCLSD